MPKPRPERKRKPHEFLEDNLSDFRFFSSPDGQRWAQPTDDIGHFVFPIHHPSFRHFLRDRLRFIQQPLAGDGSIRRVVANFDAMAQTHRRDDIQPALRVTSRPEPATIALNLCTGSALEISKDKIDIADENFIFHWFDHTLGLPTPEPDPDNTALPTLRRLLRLPTEDDWLKALTWLLSACRPKGPFPILILQGPTGSGKSEVAKALRHLVDPNKNPLNELPVSSRRIQEHASENWVALFDHVTALSPKKSATLCGLSQGITYDQRLPKGDHLPVTQSRPIILTVTPDCKIPEEIQSRALLITLPEIEDESRRTTRDLEAALNAIRPKVFTRLILAIQTALQCEDTIEVTTLPRMADAAKWAMAASPALGVTDHLMRQAQTNYWPMDRLAAKIEKLLTDRQEWQGTATELIDALKILENPNQLSRTLNTQALAKRLSAKSITIDFTRTHATRQIKISKQNSPADPATNSRSPLNSTSPTNSTPSNSSPTSSTSHTNSTSPLNSSPSGAGLLACAGPPGPAPAGTIEKFPVIDADPAGEQNPAPHPATPERPRNSTPAPPSQAKIADKPCAE